MKYSTYTTKRVIVTPADVNEDALNIVAEHMRKKASDAMTALLMGSAVRSGLVTSPSDLLGLASRFTYLPKA